MNMKINIGFKEKQGLLDKLANTLSLALSMYGEEYFYKTTIKMIKRKSFKDEVLTHVADAILDDVIKYLFNK